MNQLAQETQKCMLIWKHLGFPPDDKASPCSKDQPKYSYHKANKQSVAISLCDLFFNKYRGI